MNKLQQHNNIFLYIFTQITGGVPNLGQCLKLGHL